MAVEVDLYEATYSNFQLGVRQRVRAETYGHDIGQNGWSSIDEWRTALDWLQLAPGSRVLDVACGCGGPDLYLARTTGAKVVGVDINNHAVQAATKSAQREGLAALARFEQADASRLLPFDDACFDAVICVDAINHLPDRLRVLRDWYRLVAPGGRIFFTDPIVVSGLLTSEEIALRASIGLFVFSLPDENERLLRAAGFELTRCEDTTERVVLVARRWRDARARHRTELLQDEGAETFAGLQRFLAIVTTLAEERRLSRHAYLARKLAAAV